MTALQPLLARGRYSDEEWEYASAGRCGWYTANYPGDAWCGGPSDPKSIYRYCASHDEDAREYDTYGR